MGKIKKGESVDEQITKKESEFLIEKIKKIPDELFTIPVKPKILAKTIYFDPNNGKPMLGEILVCDYAPDRPYYIIINPADSRCYIKFEPRNSDGELIKGLITISVKANLCGIKQRVYACSSEFHDPTMEISKVGNHKHWQFGMVVSPGDNIQVEFLRAADYELDVNKSVLEIVVTRKKIM